MAYAFNEDRSKVEVYSKQQSDSIESITNARIDTLVNSGFGGIEVRDELFSFSGGTWSNTITLSRATSNFDCLELEIGYIYNSVYHAESIVRTPVDSGSISWSQSQEQNSHVQVSVHAVDFTVSGGTMLTLYPPAPGGTIAVNGNGTIIEGSDYPVIGKVYGIKYAQDCSAEVSDARVGVDGTLYSSAGDAIRAQIEDLENGPADSLVTPRYIDGFKFDGSSDVVRLFTTESAADARSKVITYPDSWSGTVSANEKFNIQTNGTIFFVQFKNGHDFGNSEEESLELSFPNYQSSSAFALPIVVNGQYTNHLEEDFTIPPNAIVTFMTVISHSTRCAQILSIS